MIATQSILSVTCLLRARRQVELRVHCVLGVEHEDVAKQMQKLERILVDLSFRLLSIPTLPLRVLSSS